MTNGCHVAAPARAGLFALSLTFTALLTGCPGGTGPDAGTDGGVVTGCTQSSDCGDGFVCAGGACTVGECVDSVQPLCDQDPVPQEIADLCCRPWELCNFDYTCAPDPNAVVGSQCLESADCATPGDFCSGGTCYPSGGRQACTASFQCPTGERCDRTVFLCVPDIGGCELCDELPELCCEDTQLCDEEEGFCIDISDVECDTDDDCLPGKVCDPFGRCVQCITDDDCGPGTSCNEGTGSCISNVFSCETDEDCDAPRLCSPLTSECVNPQCVGDAQCVAEDPRQVCDLNTYTCFLPAADCEETDEPNDTVAEATPITLQGAYAGTLCRGNSDVLGFPVQGDKRYRVTVSVPDFNASGVTVAVLNGNGIQVDADTFASFDDDVTVSAITAVGETGSYYVRITGAGEDADLWAYTVSIQEENAPMVIDCAEEMASGIEPNEDFATAYDIMPGATTFARCDDNDEDFYRIEIPSQHGLEVTIEFDNELGDMELEIFDTEGGSPVDSSDGASSDIERVEVAESTTTVYWIRAALWSSFATGVDGQPYTLTATLIPRPEVCADDPGEPGNDTVLGASTLPLNTTVTHRNCVDVDVDNHAITVPANFGGEVAISFNHTEGDLRLDLYDSNEALIGSSNTSTGPEAVELVELPFSGSEATYYARVRLAGASGTVGQQYTIEATTYDASTCVASEPLPNNSAIEGRCVGDFVSTFPCASTPLALPVDGPSLASCATDPGQVGCGTLCGAGDEDWYRVGKLNNGQVLSARLEYDPGPDGGPSPGRMGLALARANPSLTQATYVQYDPNVDDEGVLQLVVSVPTVAEPYAREYMVVVTPEGTDGFAAQPYSLDITVGAPCFADPGEPNGHPGESTILRQSGGTPPYSEDVTASLCAFDTDVYELFAFAGEDVTATLLGPPGVTVDIGTRPSPLTEPAVTVAAGAAVAGPCPIAAPDLDGGVVDGGGPVVEGDNCQQATFSNDQVRQLYLTVRRTQDTLDAVGPYLLRLEVD